MTLSELIARLEAATEGSRGLDLAIERIAVGSVPLHWRVGSQGTILSNLDDANECVPYYTTSLDASLPRENIVSVGYDTRDGFWRAAHLANPTAQQVYFGTARTEPLARRIASLKAMEDK